MLRTYTQASINPWKLLDQISNETLKVKPSAYPLDVTDQGDHLRITINLPGANPEGVDVKLERNILTVTAKLESADTDPKYLWRERPGGEVHRSVKLPVRLNPDATTANLEHGVRTVTVAKAAESTARAIQVNAGPVVVQAEPTTDAIQS
jgi:HSP20 family protein